MPFNYLLWFWLSLLSRNQTLHLRLLCLPWPFSCLLEVQETDPVSQSSAKPKYRSMASASFEIMWLKYLIVDLQILHPQPTTLYCNSQSTLHIASNLVFYKITKHIELNCHLIRDKIQIGNISTAYTPYNSQLADLLTKALHSNIFSSLLLKMEVINIHSPSCGRYWTSQHSHHNSTPCKLPQVISQSCKYKHLLEANHNSILLEFMYNLSNTHYDFFIIIFYLAVISIKSVNEYKCRQKLSSNIQSIFSPLFFFFGDNATLIQHNK